MINDNQVLRALRLSDELVFRLYHGGVLVVPLGASTSAEGRKKLSTGTAFLQYVYWHSLLFYPSLIRKRMTRCPLFAQKKGQRLLSVSPKTDNKGNGVYNRWTKSLFISAPLLSPAVSHGFTREEACAE